MLACVYACRFVYVLAFALIASPFRHGTRTSEPAIHTPYTRYANMLWYALCTVCCVFARAFIFVCGTKHFRMASVAIHMNILVMYFVLMCMGDCVWPHTHTRTHAHMSLMVFGVCYQRSHQMQLKLKA